MGFGPDPISGQAYIPLGDVHSKGTLFHRAGILIFGGFYSRGVMFGISHILELKFMQNSREILKLVFE